MLKLINGEIDLIQNDLPLEMIKLIEENKDLNIIGGFGSNISYVGFNFKDKNLRNKKLRLAISMAINQSEILEYFLPEKSRLSSQILPPEHWASFAFNENNFDPDQARRLISEINLSKPLNSF